MKHSRSHCVSHFYQNSFLSSHTNDALHLHHVLPSLKIKLPISAGIFNGKYGSEMEFHLESQLDTLLDRKQRIGVAKYKWTNARVLLQYAVNQLAFSVKRWGEVIRVRSE